MRILFSLFPGSGFILGRRFQPTATEAWLPDPRHRDCLGREVALLTLLDDYGGVRLRNRSAGNRLRADGEEAGQHAFLSLRFGASFEVLAKPMEGDVWPPLLRFRVERDVGTAAAAVAHEATPPSAFAETQTADFLAAPTAESSVGQIPLLRPSAGPPAAGGGPLMRAREDIVAAAEEPTAALAQPRLLLPGPVVKAPPAARTDPPAPPRSLPSLLAGWGAPTRDLRQGSLPRPLAGDGHLFNGDATLILFDPSRQAWAQDELGRLDGVAIVRSRVAPQLGDYAVVEFVTASGLAFRHAVRDVRSRLEGTRSCILRGGLWSVSAEFRTDAVVLRFPVPGQAAEFHRILEEPARLDPDSQMATFFQQR